MDDVWHTQIKAAQRDLIAAAGGIERVARLTSYGKSTVGRWNNPADPELMPLPAVRLLERDTDQPLITTIMGHETGRRLSEPHGPVTEAGALDQMIRRLLIDVVELAGNGSAVTADGHVTPAEATGMQPSTSRARETLRQIEQLIGAIKAQGGASADLRLVGEA